MVGDARELRWRSVLGKAFWLENFASGGAALQKVPWLDMEKAMEVALWGLADGALEVLQPVLCQSWDPRLGLASFRTAASIVAEEAATAKEGRHGGSHFLDEQPAEVGGGFGWGGHERDGASFRPAVAASSAVSCHVDVRVFESLTAAHGSLHGVYQALCDPCTVVYEMGTVEDCAAPPPPQTVDLTGGAGGDVGGGGAGLNFGGLGVGGLGVGGGGEGAAAVTGHQVTGQAEAPPVTPSPRVLCLPTPVEGLLGLPIKQICCGGQHAAVLTRSGRVLTWGRGGFGRLGHGRRDAVPSPKAVEALFGERCVQVACGFAYTAAVTADGKLFTWGAGENGRLGLGDDSDRLAPALVSHIWDPPAGGGLGEAGGEKLGHLPVREVYAGSVHTCVLTFSGEVLSFGKFEYTGHGIAEGSGADVLLPRRLEAFGDKTVDQISVGPGGYHTIALTSDREVFTWGHNRVGQLGYTNSEVVPRNGEGAHFLPTPKAVSALRGLAVRTVVAGWGHTAALTASGEVLICGRNYCGQLGLGDPDDFPRNERNHPFQAQFVPVKTLGGKQTIQIACGGEHTAGEDAPPAPPFAPGC